MFFLSLVQQVSVGPAASCTRRLCGAILGLERGCLPETNKFARTTDSDAVYHANNVPSGSRDRLATMNRTRLRAGTNDSCLTRYPVSRCPPPGRRLQEGLGGVHVVLHVRQGLHGGREEDHRHAVVQRGGRDGRVVSVEQPARPHLLVHAPNHGTPLSVSNERFCSLRLFSLLRKQFSLFFFWFFSVMMVSREKLARPVAQPRAVLFCLFWTTSKISVDHVVIFLRGERLLFFIVRRRYSGTRFHLTSPSTDVLSFASLMPAAAAAVQFQASLWNVHGLLLAGRSGDVGRHGRRGVRRHHLDAL